MRGEFGGYFYGKRVLVTGHTGFKGAWLSLWLTRLGAEVIGLSDAVPTEPSFFEAVGLRDIVKDLRGDIRHLDRVEDTFEAEKPEIVLHLAAQPIVRRSYREPVPTFATNVMGTIHVLEAARNCPSVRAVICITSDKCYENLERVNGFREDDPMGGHDPYSASKGAAELAIAAYRSLLFAGGAGVASARAGNVIGGGDWGEDRLVPDCMRALAKGEAIVLRRPESTRPWQFVLEPVSGYLWLGALLAQNRERAQPWNFGPEESELTTVKAVTDAVVSHWGSGNVVIRRDESVHEAKFLRLDCSKARLELRWRPTLSTAAAISQTVAWYKRFYEGGTSAELRHFSEEQIEQHTAKAREQGIAWAGTP